MRKAGGSIVAAGAAAVLVAVTAASAAAKTVSAEKYARSLCDTLDDLLESGNELLDTYNNDTSDDPPTFHREAIELVNGRIAELEAAAKKLKKLTPDVSGGKKISRTFSQYLQGQADDLQDAVDVFAGADPNGIAFQADVTALEVAFNLLSTTAGDPFSEVTNQDLLQALDEESRCADVVTVF
ncbi:MAG: hypothetical protein L0206_12960 [Actinobacteria bacterium]|nr:hypothetical protein [Actinomycetota bacterium]